MRVKYVSGSLGLIFIAAAVAVSGSDIERAFRGSAEGQLTWGPALFRVMLGLHGCLLIFWTRLSGPSPQAAHPVPTNRPTNDQATNDQATDDQPTNGQAKAGGQISLTGPSKAEAVGLGSLILLSLALRLWNLDSGLWLDEIFTLLDYGRSGVGEVATSFPTQNQHMLYSLLIHIPLSLFGESGWAIRLPAAVFGAVTLWPIFMLGKKVFGTREAFGAAALMTVSYHHVWFSQNARGYTALLFFATLATWLWLEARSNRRAFWWPAYTVSLLFGLWVHTTMLFVVIAHGLVWAGETAPGFLKASQASARPSAEAIWKPLAAWTLAGTLSLQVYALALPEFLRSALQEQSRGSEWTKPAWALSESLRSLQIGGWGVAGVLFGGALAAAGWLALFRRNRSTAMLMIVPGLLGGSLVALLQHNLWPRFFFFCLSFALLVLIHGAFMASRLLLGALPSVSGIEQRSRQLGTAMVALMVVASALSLPRGYALPKQDFQGARSFVETQRRPGDAIVAVGLAGRVYCDYFAPDWICAQENEALQQAKRSGGDVWLVYTLPAEIRAFQPEVWRTIESEFEIVKSFPGTLGGGDIFVCKSRGAPAANHAGLASADFPVSPHTARAAGPFNENRFTAGI